MDTIDLIEQYMSSLKLELTFSYLRRAFEDLDYTRDYSNLFNRPSHYGFPDGLEYNYLIIGPRRSGKTSYLLDKIKYLLNNEEDVCINLILPYGNERLEKEISGYDMHNRGFGLESLGRNYFINRRTSSILNILSISPSGSSGNMGRGRPFKNCSKQYIFIDDVFELPSRYFFSLFEHMNFNLNSDINLIAVGDNASFGTNDNFGSLLLTLDEPILKRYDINYSKDIFNERYLNEFKFIMPKYQAITLPVLEDFK